MWLGVSHPYYCSGLALFTDCAAFKGASLSSFKPSGIFFLFILVMFHEVEHGMVMSP